MNNDSPPLAETIFIAAREISHTQEREAYLARACGDDRELHQRVERMLRAEQQADHFLADNPLELDVSPPASAGAMEKPGSMIGRYKLLQKIGEGGCGVVYMAEQEEPIRRRVALKVIKLGMDTEQVIARFEAERQALAMMDHPNIARVLDAGATDTGRPYFVMELVRGIKITGYCDQNNLSTRERLGLFTSVAQAIQHAHQKGIIHRDIKPSNVLVTLHDGVPVPKVIDFGVAKAMEQKLTDKTLFTQFEQFIGTPAYTSPEQAEMSGLDIDTRSDIYSLGVLLYELLVGRTPFESQELLRSGLNEMRRLIREKEPSRPSTVLSTMLAQDRTATAQHRGASAPELVHLLKGDLDWIVMKCLEKDRTRRYETVSGLAADIRNYLSHETVTARPPTAAYRFGKLVRRNKLAFASAAAVALALIAGVIVSTWQAARAHRAELAAREEQESAEAVLKFVRDNILAAGRPEGQEGGLGKDVTLRKAIDAAESKISDAFKDRPVVEAAIRKTIGESYHYLGEAALAVPQLERSLELRRKSFGFLHERTASILRSLQAAYRSQGTPDQALPLYEEILKLTEEKHGPEHPDTLTAMHTLASAYWEAGKLDQAMTLNQKTLELRKETLGPDHDVTLSTMNNLGLVYGDAEKLDEAITLFEETLERRRKTLGDEHGNTLTTMRNLNVVYRRAGRHDQSLAVARKILDLTERMRGPEHPATLSAMQDLAIAYANLGKLDEAMPRFEKTIKLRQDQQGAEHPDTVQSVNAFAEACRKAGMPDRPLHLYMDLRKRMEEKYGPEHPRTLTAMHNLGLAYSEAGKHDQARELLEETLRLRTTKLGREHLHTLSTMSNLGLEYLRQGKSDQAVALFEETVSLHTIKLGPEHPDSLRVMHLLGEALVAARKYDEALPLLQETYRGREKKLGRKHPDTLRTMHHLAIATEYATSGTLDQALPLYEETYKLMQEPAHPDILQTTENLGDVYRAAGKLAQAETLYRNALELKDDSLNATLGLARVLSERANTDITDPAQSRARREECLELAHKSEDLARRQHAHDKEKLENSLESVVEVYYRNGRYAEAATLYLELVQGRRERLGDGHKETIGSTASLGRLLADWAWAERAHPTTPSGSQLSTLNAQPSPFDRAREAERRLRECLALRLRGDGSAPWKVSDVKSRLGGALVSVAVTDSSLDAVAREAKLAEAEPLLLEGHKGLQASESAAKKYKRDAVERLVRLYDARNEPGKLAEWRQKLADMDKPAGGSVPAVADGP